MENNSFLRRGWEATSGYWRKCGGRQSWLSSLAERGGRGGWLVMLINNILSVSCVGMSRNWGFVEKMQPVKDKEVQSQEMRPGRVV